MRHLSARVVDTGMDIVAIWYSRRLITRDAVQIPMLDAIVKRVAARDISHVPEDIQTRGGVLTDIAIHRCDILRVIPPDDLVEALDQVLSAHPEYVQNAANVRH